MLRIPHAAMVCPTGKRRTTKNDGPHSAAQRVLALEYGVLSGNIHENWNCFFVSAVASGGSGAGAGVAHEAGRRRGGHEQVGRPVRGFLSVRLRELDGLASVAGGSRALRAVRGVAGPQRKGGAGHTASRGGRRRPGRNEIGTEDRRLLRQLHGHRGHRKRGIAPIRAELDRIYAMQHRGGRGD